MNDDKDRILQACNSFSAEELFHFIRSGNLTLLDLVRAGLDDNKLVGLQELMAIEEDDLWAEVQTKRTPALCRRYLQAYPNGRYAGRCTKLMLQLADEPGGELSAPDEMPATDRPATPSDPPAPPQAEPSISEEDKLWHEVQTKRTMQLCGRYLQTYPNGRHAGECAKIISQLTEKQNEPKEHAAATSPADNSRPTAPSAPVKRRKQNKKPSRGLLWGSAFLTLLLAVLVWQLSTGGSESQFSKLADYQPVEVPESILEDTTSTPYSINDTINMLYDDVKQNLLYFHNERTWNEEKFDDLRWSLEELYKRKDEDKTAHEYLTLIDRNIVALYYGNTCTQDLRLMIIMEVNEEDFNNFIKGLESQIKKWNKERRKKEQRPQAREPLSEPSPKQKTKDQGNNPSKSKARDNDAEPKGRARYGSY